MQERFQILEGMEVSLFIRLKEGLSPEDRKRVSDYILDVAFKDCYEGFNLDRMDEGVIVLGCSERMWAWFNKGVLRLKDDRRVFDALDAVYYWERHGDRYDALENLRLLWTEEETGVRQPRPWNRKPGTEHDVPEYEVWIRLKARLKKETREHVESLILDAFQGLEDTGDEDGLFRFGGDGEEAFDIISDGLIAMAEDDVVFKSIAAGEYHEGRRPEDAVDLIEELKEMRRIDRIGAGFHS